MVDTVHDDHVAGFEVVGTVAEDQVDAPLSTISRSMVSVWGIGISVFGALVDDHPADEAGLEEQVDEVGVALRS
ncbi:hypothetical protein ORI20_32260 [Mycobacterium sp. CVI_P3]|uniref:Uncharacterized protein n=1 Tax=Mycobacterium pinniadriaticum TaxID=2994102 RepID=A0ABT3SPB8_9MYCO|nr:hypothetical protein [Mycobacterium pinniadriaticum]MCX2934938.1 hypothetical protein [Mycobacterium pinniadriaticum]MCX2941360.1 hypothetical protein [Mycobacterium pinniadriaticum]